MGARAGRGRVIGVIVADVCGNEAIEARVSAGGGAACADTASPAQIVTASTAVRAAPTAIVVRAPSAADVWVWVALSLSVMR